jgi:hypothetical protein
MMQMRVRNASPMGKAARGSEHPMTDPIRNSDLTTKNFSGAGNIRQQL